MALDVGVVYAWAAVLLVQALGAAECTLLLEEVRILQWRSAAAFGIHQERSVAGAVSRERDGLYDGFTHKELRELSKIVPSLIRYGRVCSGASLKTGWTLIVFFGELAEGKLRSTMRSENLALLQIAFAYPFALSTFFALKERPQGKRPHRILKKATQLFPFIAVSVWYILSIHNATSGFAVLLGDKTLLGGWIYYTLCALVLLHIISFFCALFRTYSVRKFLSREDPASKTEVFRLMGLPHFAILRHILAPSVALYVFMDVGGTEQPAGEVVYYITATAAFLFVHWTEDIWKGQAQKMARSFANDSAAETGFEGVEDGNWLNSRAPPGPQAAYNRRMLCWKPSI